MSNTSPDVQTVGQVIKHYMSNYPDGRGSECLSLEDTAKLTMLPRSTLSRWINDEIEWDLLVKMHALRAALGIPRDTWNAAVLGLEQPVDEE